MKQQNDIHVLCVKNWEDKNAKDLGEGPHVQLFIRALDSIQNVARITLSRVTLKVIIDRVLHQSKAIYPMLGDVKIKDESLNFNDLLAQMDQYDPDLLIPALRHLLIELLSILGRITADILTGPLHKELLSVTSATTSEKI